MVYIEKFKMSRTSVNHKSSKISIKLGKIKDFKYSKITPFRETEIRKSGHLMFFDL